MNLAKETENHVAGNENGQSTVAICVLTFRYSHFVLCLSNSRNVLRVSARTAGIAFCPLFRYLSVVILML